ncbi:hypothetical protein TNCT_133041 [Trichonephila clavata]|uniref:Uncharacterized protein n=1 Tax=Trichonephila clavata TaxID=2740835 RepID=A0A8X6F9K8_TRICU|nr:hypothetical protein TNCT_133041 [Trichonephila clavata]
MNYRKVCCQCLLSEHQKKQRMGLSLQHSLHYRDDGGDFLKPTVAGDETWCHHFQPEGKSISIQWRFSYSPIGPKNSKLNSQFGKVMLEKN